VAWVRIHDGALTHPKLVGLSDKGFRLWVWGLSYCQQHLTDGYIPSAALPSTSKKAITEMTAAGLWSVSNGGYAVHDFLQWNDDRETVRNRQRLAKHRQAFLNDPGLRQALRRRDGDQCRYCGAIVNWSDRRGVTGATYDHVDPRGDATMDNIVIACRGCNSRKRDRHPAEAGMRLRPAPKSDLGLDLGLGSGNFQATEPNQTEPKKRDLAGSVD
jgi:hypothetical protein